MAKTDFSFEKTEESSGFLLWQVTNFWQREIKKALEKYELTHSQFVLLASIHWLTLDKQNVTQILLSNHTKIDPMTTSAGAGVGYWWQSGGNRYFVGYASCNSSE